MKKLLVSACLLGDQVRYDGNSKTLSHPGLARLRDQGRIIGFCPEVAGGLPIPRPPAEIKGGDGAAVIGGMARVKTRDDTDVTDYFVSGANQALALCQQHAIRIAILTESSPSCGSSAIYDGSFTRNAVAGSGVTAALLKHHGIEVFNQHQLDAAISLLESDHAKD